MRGGNTPAPRVILPNNGEYRTPERYHVYIEALKEAGIHGV